MFLHVFFWLLVQWLQQGLELPREWRFQQLAVVEQSINLRL
jgi:hypothetical protein